MSEETPEPELNPEELTDELARKYDPARLLKLFAKRAGKGEALDLSIRQRYEKRFGVDLSHVRVVTGEFAEEFNKERGANAVTIGGTGMILMGGHADMSPIGASGQALLAHELTHVAQAERGLHFDRSNAPLATEEHEQEAEAVEAEEHAQASGQAAHAHAAAAAEHHGEKERAKMLDAVMHRVMDMFAEAGRVDWMRNGFNPRRP